MVQDGICSYMWKRFTHDDEMDRSLRLNGFGICAADAIMDLKNFEDDGPFDQEVEFKDLRHTEKHLIEEQRKALVSHLYRAPVFFPSDLNAFDEWFLQPGIRVFVVRELIMRLLIRRLCGFGVNILTAMYTVTFAELMREWLGMKIMQKITGGNKEDGL